MKAAKVVSELIEYFTNNGTLTPDQLAYLEREGFLDSSCKLALVGSIACRRLATDEIITKSVGFIQFRGCDLASVTPEASFKGKQWTKLGLIPIERYEIGDHKFDYFVAHGFKVDTKYKDGNQMFSMDYMEFLAVPYGYELIECPHCKHLTDRMRETFKLTTVSYSSLPILSCNSCNRAPNCVQALCNLMAHSYSYSNWLMDGTLNL